MMQVSVRARILLQELERLAAEYQTAKVELDEAQMRFEIVKQSLSKTKELASEVMTWLDLHSWQLRYPGVKYAATAIGPAILDILDTNAREAAERFLDSTSTSKVFFTALSLSQIEVLLEAGGFEFNSVTPKREINAALINLTGVKRGKHGLYMLSNADEILTEVQGWREWGQEQQEQTTTA